jgi:hypothetical protein
MTMSRHGWMAADDIASAKTGRQCRVKTSCKNANVKQAHKKPLLRNEDPQGYDIGIDKDNACKQQHTCYKSKCKKR